MFVVGVGVGVVVVVVAVVVWTVVVVVGGGGAVCASGLSIKLDGLFVLVADPGSLGFLFWFLTRLGVAGF